MAARIIFFSLMNVSTMLSSVYLSVFLSVCLSDWLAGCVSVWVCLICLSVCLPACLPACLPFCVTPSLSLPHPPTAGCCPPTAGCCPTTARCCCLQDNGGLLAYDEVRLGLQRLYQDHRAHPEPMRHPPLFETVRRGGKLSLFSSIVFVHFVSPLEA